MAKSQKRRPTCADDAGPKNHTQNLPYCWGKPQKRARELGFGPGPNVVTFGVDPSQTTKKYNIWPKPMVLGPRTWVWARCGNFWLFWEGFTTKKHNIRPKPMVLGSDHGFGPEVVLFSLTPPGASQKPSPFTHYTSLQRTRSCLTQTGGRARSPPPSLFSTSTPPEPRTNTVCHLLLEKRATNDADDAAPLASSASLGPRFS